MQVRTSERGSEPTDCASDSPGRLVLLLGVLGAGLTYLLIQYMLETARFRSQFLSFVETYGPQAARSMESPVLPNLVTSATNFLAISVGGVVLVHRGRRKLFIIPAAFGVVLPWLANRFGVSSAYPLGQGWPNAPGTWPLSRFLVGTTIDLALAMTPALILLFFHRSELGDQAPFDSARTHFSLRIAALASCLYVIAIYLWVASMLGEPMMWQSGRALWAVVIPTCLFGLLFGLRSIGDLPALILVPILAWWEFTLIAPDGQIDTWPRANQVTQALPLVLLTTLIALWDPLADGLGKLRQSKLGLYVSLNVLNVADAALTVFATHQKQAAEMNPVIGVIGLPGKILLVALACWLVVRIRPDALLWPTLALAAVLVWHLGGYVVNARLL
jgi:hypothetical protein